MQSDSRESLVQNEERKEAKHPFSLLSVNAKNTELLSEHTKNTEMHANIINFGFNIGMGRFDGNNAKHERI